MIKINGPGDPTITWTGTLTLYAGKMSLNLTTNRGVHRFKLKFNASSS